MLQEMRILTVHIGLVALLFLSGCGQASRGPANDRAGSEKVDIHRYGEVLFSLDPANILPGLDSISEEFRFFLGDDYSDTVNITRIQDFLYDPLIRDLANNCRTRYRDLDWLKVGLGDAFSRTQNSFASFKAPAVYTYVSGLYYEAPVQYYDSLLVIALDMYLGPQFEPYRKIGLPYYMVRRLSEASILPDCMREVGYSLMAGKITGKTLLDNMISHGKLLYFLDVVLPHVPDSAKTGFTPAQLEWCRDNESELWTYLIDQELLFSTESFTINKFIQDGPFTSGMPPESPAMLGKWLGWRIVRSYMEKNTGITPEQLFSDQDSQGLLSRSGYKPSR